MAESDRDSLEAKVTALLAISVDRYLRETGIAKPRPRSIDRLLVDAGLPVKDVARVLGKTDRAVYLAVEGGQKKTVRRKSPTKKSTGGSPVGVGEEGATDGTD